MNNKCTEFNKCEESICALLPIVAVQFLSQPTSRLLFICPATARLGAIRYIQATLSLDDDHISNLSGIESVH